MKNNWKEFILNTMITLMDVIADIEEHKNKTVKIRIDALSVLV